jgi:hypothetical protein
MYTLPGELGIKELPWGNWTMAGCFVGPHSSVCAEAATDLRVPGHSLRLSRRHLAPLPQP